METVTKSARVKSHEAADSDMEAINRFALSPLSKEDVFCFEVVACDNEVDRDFERFGDEGLEKMARLMEGRTVIKDHMARADNQLARIYECSVESPGGTTSDGREYRQLVAKCYALAGDPAVADIKAGIKKEVSVSFRPSSVLCSVCGTDRAVGRCKHEWGREYDGELCSFEFADVSDAYELSFVAIPAQRAAGTRKGYMDDEEEAALAAEEKAAEDARRKREIALAGALLALADY